MINIVNDINSFFWFFSTFWLIRNIFRRALTVWPLFTKIWWNCQIWSFVSISKKLLSKCWVPKMIKNSCLFTWTPTKLSNAISCQYWVILLYCFIMVEIILHTIHIDFIVKVYVLPFFQTILLRFIYYTSDLSRVGPTSRKYIKHLNFHFIDGIDRAWNNFNLGLK